MKIRHTMLTFERTESVHAVCYGVSSQIVVMHYWQCLLPARLFVRIRHFSGADGAPFAFARTMSRHTLHDAVQDGSGEIDLDELRTVMTSLGYSPTDKQLEDMMAKVKEAVVTHRRRISVRSGAK